MTNPERKLLQEALSNRGWLLVEQFLEDYIESLNLKGSMKRQNDFETIWQRAEAEGGEFHLRNFMNQLDEEARKLN